MDKGRPHVMTELECPVLKKKEQVEFSVNVFRSPEHRGLDVTKCSEFLDSKGLVTCGKDCIHGPEARELHKQEVQAHRQELSEIGPDVIG